MLNKIIKTINFLLPLQRIGFDVKNTAKQGNYVFLVKSLQIL